MEFKFKETININSFTFKKQVIEETIDLLGEKKNYVRNDIAFYAMIAFLDNMIEENMLIEALGEDKNLMDKLYDVIEPLYIEHIQKNEENYRVFTDIVEQLEEYFEREVMNKHSIPGLLYTVLDEIGNMKPEEIVKLFELFEQQVLTRMKNNKTVSTKEVQKPQKEKQLQMDEPIDNKKIEELINEFKNKNNITA